MRFSVSAVLAFAASALAQTPDFDPVYKPDAQEVIPAGQPYTITWEAPAKYADVTVSIELIGGSTQNTQVKLATIATGVSNAANKYVWNVDASLGTESVYGLVVRSEKDTSVFQYSNPFHIKSSGGKTSASGSATQTMTTSYGKKTITLSSCTESPAPVTTTTVKNVTVPCNSTTMAILTSSKPAPVPVITTHANAQTTTAPPAPIVTGAAAALRAGSLGVLGAVAVVLAL